MLVSLRREPTAWIIIPAHNEEAVIRRSLKSLLDDTRQDEFRVVVVANGCSDATADIARSFGGRVSVVELEEGSKPAALNAGDRACSGFPRIYLDADVELSADGARALAAALSSQHPTLATAKRSFQLVDATPFARSYFQTADALRHSRGEIAGSGVYALNAAGRRRFDDFPDAIGDDTFVQGQFRRSERIEVDSLVKVWPPQSMRDILSVKTRAVIGNLTATPGPGTRDRPALHIQAKELARNPKACVGLPLYFVITLMLRSRARARIKRGDLSWSRDRRSAV